MKELIYADKKIEKLITNKFPEAITKDATDLIHKTRFSLELPDSRKKEFYIFATENYFIDLCLGLYLIIKNDETEIISAIEDKINEMEVKS